MPMVCRMIVSIAAFAAVVSMSGCLISGSSRSYSSGARVSEHLLVGFEPGQTAYDEIEQTLGVPTRTINRPDGSTVLVYEFTEVDDRESGLLFVFHSETYRKTTKTTYIEVIDGIFERAWVETCS